MQYKNHITREIKTPIRENITWKERWQDEDKGLISCWEKGRQKNKTEPKLAQKTMNYLCLAGKVE